MQGGGSLLDVENKTVINTYRPPPGFMDADGPADTAAAQEGQDPQVRALLIVPSISYCIILCVKEVKAETRNPNNGDIKLHGT